MKVEVLHLPIDASNMDRVFTSTPIAFEQSREISSKERFQALYLLPSWGLSGVLFSGNGFFALIGDSSGRIDAIAPENMAVQRWSNDTFNRRQPVWYPLKEPNVNEEEGSPLRHWHTQLNKQRHDGLTIANFMEREILEFSVTW
jgi:hypothetical protein